MSRKIKKGSDWTKLLIVLSLVCSVFSLSVNAQTDSDKPLNAQQLANLKTGLKEVLQENLAVAEKDGKKYTAITRKWDARKDLAGKSKTQVINSMYRDVKSVVTDSGMQYQISSIFSMYKQMPDEQFSGQTKSTMGSDSKPEAVKQLTNLTFASHPYVGIEKELADLPGMKDAEAGRIEDKKNRIEGFDAALKVNNKLNANQKVFVRANYDQLIKITDKITEDAINKNFPTEQWIMEGLDQSYSAKFTLKELNDLIHFFDSDNGNQVLKYIRQTQMADLITGNGGKLDFTAADKAEHDKFAAVPLGKKFIAAFLKEATAYEEGKENAVRSKNTDADGFAIYQPANLNKLFNQFVNDNYKK